MTLARTRNSCLAAFLLLAASAPRVAGSQQARALRSGPTDDATSVDQSGFESRRLAGKGRFLTHADITARRAPRVSDLFTGMAGITVMDLPAGGAALAATGPARASLASRGPCLAEVYLDGIRQTPPSQATPVDVNRLPLQSLHGVEIYRQSEAPPQFSSQQGCPVILFWTRVNL